MADETVLCKLDWTYGVNVDGRVVYFGPGLVPVPRDVARRKGWWTPSEEETAVFDDTAVESDDVRARTNEAREVWLAYAVTEVAGVPEGLAVALEAAGFATAVSIRDADPKDLVDIPGIGEKTAQKLQKAAAQLLAGDNA